MGKANLRIRNKKALSPIFATLIILAVVTVLFIPVFIWATGIASQNQDSWQQSGTTATERIVVEEVNLKSGQTTCTVYVRNIGKTAVTINNVLISLADGTGTIHIYEGTNTAVVSITPSSVVQGDLITISISPLGFPIVKSTYDIKVFTTRGVSDEYQAVT
jgi:flagellin-like protein